eukprot:TRINITY_DN34825_c0_g1_i2.p1 TRINITY_DN34825_c0_g1~~TRINITY_DN34825_c0_g1_i2.p1  ORF type:complete len:1128 (-),score=290.36 TRINITY_DN34825_c0_g1_i2:86-3469(-)
MDRILAGPTGSDFAGNLDVLGPLLARGGDTIFDGRGASSVAIGARVRVREGKQFRDFASGDSGIVVGVDHDASVCQVVFDGRSGSQPLQVSLRHLELSQGVVEDHTRSWGSNFGVGGGGLGLGGSSLGSLSAPATTLEEPVASSQNWPRMVPDEHQEDQFMALLRGGSGYSAAMTSRTGLAAESYMQESQRSSPRRQSPKALTTTTLDTSRDDAASALKEAVEACASATASCTASGRVEVITLRLATDELRELLLQEREQRNDSVRRLEERLERLRGDQAAGVEQLQRGVEARLAQKQAEVLTVCNSLQVLKEQLGRLEGDVAGTSSQGQVSHLEERLRQLTDRQVQLSRAQGEEADSINKRLDDILSQSMTGSREHAARLEERLATVEQTVRAALERLQQLAGRADVLDAALGEHSGKAASLARSHAETAAKLDLHSDVHAELRNSLDTMAGSLAQRLDRLHGEHRERLVEEVGRLQEQLSTKVEQLASEHGGRLDGLSRTEAQLGHLSRSHAEHAASFQELLRSHDAHGLKFEHMHSDFQVKLSAFERLHSERGAASEELERRLREELRSSCEELARAHPELRAKNEELLTKLSMLERSHIELAQSSPHDAVARSQSGVLAERLEALGRQNEELQRTQRGLAQSVQAELSALRVPAGRLDELSMRVESVNADLSAKLADVVVAQSKAVASRNGPSSPRAAAAGPVLEDLAATSLALAPRLERLDKAHVELSSKVESLLEAERLRTLKAGLALPADATASKQRVDELALRVAGLSGTQATFVKAEQLEERLLSFKKEMHSGVKAELQAYAELQQVRGEVDVILKKTVTDINLAVSETSARLERQCAEAVRVGQRASDALESHCEVAREREKLLEVMQGRLDELSEGLRKEVQQREDGIAYAVVANSAALLEQRPLAPPVLDGASTPPRSSLAMSPPSSVQPPATQAAATAMPQKHCVCGHPLLEESAFCVRCGRQQSYGAQLSAPRQLFEAAADGYGQPDAALTGAPWWAVNVPRANGTHVRARAVTPPAMTPRSLPTTIPQEPIAVASTGVPYNRLAGVANGQHAVISFGQSLQPPSLRAASPGPTITSSPLDITKRATLHGLSPSGSVPIDIEVVGMSMGALRS